MAEVRAGVDALDRALVDLIATRMAYMEAAARIKPSRADVRDEERKREVIANARARADALGLDPDWIAHWWDQLVERSIAYEFDVWDRTRPAKRAAG